MIRRNAFLTILAATLTTGSGVLAQSTASITGVVVDTDGAVIPGAGLDRFRWITAPSVRARKNAGLNAAGALLTGS